MQIFTRKKKKGFTPHLSRKDGIRFHIALLRKKGVGFTLIELLVVIAIIGVLASTILASLNTARIKAKDARVLSALDQIRKIGEIIFSADGSYLNILTNADINALINDMATQGSTNILRTANEQGYCVKATLPGGKWGCVNSQLTIAVNCDSPPLCAGEPNGPPTDISCACPEEVGGSENNPPVAVISADPTSGEAPLAVNFDGSDSYDPDNDTLTYAWDFGDDSPEGTGVAVSHTYDSEGVYTATLAVTDTSGVSDTTEITIIVGQIALKPHPRLYLTDDKIDDLKGKIRSDDPTYDPTYERLWQKVKARADAGEERGPLPYNQVSQGTSGMREGMAYYMPHIALAYLITEDPDYFNSAVEYMLTVSGYADWDSNPPDLLTGHLLYATSLMYDWLYNDLGFKINESDEYTVRERVRNAITSHAEEMYLASTNQTVWWRNMNLQNHNWININGLGTAAFALEGEAQNAEAWRNESLRQYRRTMSWLNTYTDGASWEGIGYWGYGLEAILKYIWLVRDLTGEDMFDNAWLKNTALYRIYMSTPSRLWQFGRANINIADSPPYDWYGPDYQMRLLASEYYDPSEPQNIAPYAQWFARVIDESNVYGGGTTSKDSYLNLIWYNPQVPEANASGLPLFHHFKNLDITVSRSSEAWGVWGDVLAVKCGPYGGHALFDNADPANPEHSIVGEHMHPDAGHFTIYSDNAFLASDDGYGTETTRGHNTVIVNDLEQAGRISANVNPYFDTKDAYDIQSPNPPAILNAVSDGSFDKIICDATGAYPTYRPDKPNRPGAGLTRFIRQFAYYRPGGVIVVFDDLRADRDSRFEWLYHSPPFPITITNNGNNSFTIRNTNQGQMAPAAYPSLRLGLYSNKELTSSKYNYTNPLDHSVMPTIAAEPVQQTTDAWIVAAMVLGDENTTAASFVDWTDVGARVYVYKDARQYTFAFDTTSSPPDVIMIGDEANNRPEFDQDTDAIGDQTITEGEVLSLAFNAFDADEDPLTYSVSGLPQSAVMSNQVFNWATAPGEAGIYTAKFRVADGRGGFDEKAISITVYESAGAGPPILGPIGNKTADEGVLLEFEVTAADPDNDPLAFSAIGLPEGASFDPNTRIFRWTPNYSQSGTYGNITFRVTDNRLTPVNSDEETISITVRDVGGIYQGAILRYEFNQLNNNSVVDSSGNGNNATTTDSFLVNEGRGGSALRFGDIGNLNPTGDVNAGDINAIDGLTEFTVSAMVYHDTISSGSDDTIVSKGTFEWRAPLLLYRDDDDYTSDRIDTYSFIVTDSSSPGNTAYLSGDSNISKEREWQVVTVTFKADSPNGMRMYIDGVEIGRGPASTAGVMNIRSNNYSLKIGEPTTTAAKNFKGMVDEVAIWNRALTREEVAELYSTLTNL